MNGTTEYLDFGVQIGFTLYIIFTFVFVIYTVYEVLADPKLIKIFLVIICLILLLLYPLLIDVFFPYGGFY